MGYTGFLCGTCEANFSRSRRLKACVECRSLGILQWGTILAAILVTIVVVRASSQTSTRSRRRMSRILVSHLQMLSQVGGLSTTWSPLISWIFPVSSFFLIDPSSLSLTCLLFTDYWTKYIIQVLFVPMFSLFVFGITLAVEKIRGLPSNISRWYRYERLFLFFYLSLFTHLVFTVLEPFSCSPQSDGTYSMIYNPSQNCFDKQWWLSASLALVPSVIYTIITPLYISMCLVSKWESRNVQKFAIVFQPLVESFKREFKIFEVVVLIKKTIFCVVAEVLILADNMRDYLLCSMFLLFLFIEQFLQPYVSKQSNFSNTL